MAIVGNQPSGCDISKRVDATDHVIRFNRPYGFGAETGSRIDALWLVNCGGQMREWLDNDAFWSSDAIAATPEVVLTVDPTIAHYYDPPLSDDEWDAARDQDHTEAASARLAELGKTVRLLPAEVYFAAAKALGRATFTRGMPMPSTGFLAAFDAVQTAALATVADGSDIGHEPTAHPMLFNFGFAGWTGHDWAGERAWAIAQARAGRLTLATSEDDASARPALTSDQLQADNDQLARSA